MRDYSKLKTNIKPSLWSNYYYFELHIITGIFPYVISTNQLKQKQVYILHMYYV